MNHERLFYGITPHVKLPNPIFGVVFLQKQVEDLGSQTLDLVGLLQELLEPGRYCYKLNAAEELKRKT